MDVSLGHQRALIYLTGQLFALDCVVNMFSPLFYIAGLPFKIDQEKKAVQRFFNGCFLSKKDGKDQESIQSSTIPETQDTNGKVTTSQLDTNLLMQYTVTGKQSNQIYLR